MSAEGQRTAAMTQEDTRGPRGAEPCPSPLKDKFTVLKPEHHEQHVSDPTVLSVSLSADGNRLLVIINITWTHWVNLSASGDQAVKQEADLPTLSN